MQGNLGVFQPWYDGRRVEASKSASLKAHLHEEGAASQQFAREEASANRDLQVEKC